MISTLDQHQAIRWRITGSWPCRTPGQLDQAVDLRPEHDRLGRRRLASLEAEQRLRDRPAVVDPAHDDVCPGAGAGEEDLVELALARDHAGWAAPRCRVGPSGTRRNVMPCAWRRRGRCGPGRRSSREVAVGGPDLLAVDHPLVAVEHRARPREARSEPAFGSRVALAPDVLAAEDARQEVPLLLLRAPVHQRVAEHLHAERVAAADRAARPPWRTPPPGRPGSSSDSPAPPNSSGQLTER